MSDDLTGRLRAWGTAGWWDKPLKRLCVEAADRIEEQADKAAILKRVLASKEARIDELEARVPADIGMVQPEDLRGLSPYLRHGGVWGVFEVWTAEPLSGDVALWMDGPDE